MRENECPSEQESRIEWWCRLIFRQQSTPVPLTQFCRQMGINPRKFYYWRKRLREMNAANSGPPITASGSLQLASTAARETRGQAMHPLRLALECRIGMDENSTQTWTLYDGGTPIMDFNSPAL